MSSSPNTFDLLTELLVICEESDRDMHEVVRRLGAIRHRLMSPDMPKEAYGFGHRVYEVQKTGEECLCALATNLDVAKAAFDKLVEKFPHREWTLRWGMMKPAHYIPPKGQTRDRVPPRTIG